MNETLIMISWFLAIALVAFFIVRSKVKHALVVVFVWAFLLGLYMIGHKYFGVNGSNNSMIVVHVDKLSVHGDQLLYGGHTVTVEKNVPPALFLRCKEEILLRVYGGDYFLNIDDNI